MPGRSMFALLITVLFYLTSVVSDAEATSSPLPTNLSYKNGETTCPFQTINYITQTLPQQCLRTGWSSEGSYNSLRLALSAETSIGKKEGNQPTTGGYLGLSPRYLSDPTPNEKGKSQTGTSGYITSNTKDRSAGVSSSATAQVPQKESPDPYQDSDIDPLSDNAAFLSFEEWKKQMLEKAGQSPENIRNARSGSDSPENRPHPVGINNALDSLGEDGEIELDFSGFVSTDSISIALSSQGIDGTTETGNMQSIEKQRSGDAELSRKSKDAGTTCKERFNYASFDCAATVLKTNRECKGSTSVLVENKDSYMLNLCSAKNKFFIVELCNDILIDTVVLANYEFFSSTFRAFRVSISDRYPVKMEKWKEIGTYEARNTRDVQPFLVENPQIWARYLRIEFLTHYGNEYYCPVSLLRIHGQTMIDEYRNDVKAARGDGELDDDIAEPDGEVFGSQPTEIIVAQVLESNEQVLSKPAEVTFTAQPIPEPIPDVVTVTSLPANIDSLTDESQSGHTTFCSPLFEQQELFVGNCDAGMTACRLAFTKAIRTNSKPHGRKVIDGDKASKLDSAMLHLPTKSTASDSEHTPHSNKTDLLPTITSAPSVPQQTSRSQRDYKIQSTASTLSSAKAQVNHTAHTASRVLSQPPSAAPSTQESFFKSVHKRLQLLEANSTLSLQYIEEQSRILREAFTKVEKRQLAKTTTFLETLNNTVLSEIRGFRIQYDQLWQSTVLELSSQREQSQREVIALSARLSILADEIVFQKRMAILQFILILICLGLVLFSRSTAASSAAYIELSDAVHNMVAKPSASFSRYLHLDSPPGTPSRPVSRYGIFSRTVNHLRSPSNDETLVDDDGHSAQAEATLRRAMSDPAIASERRISKEGSEPDDDEEPDERPLTPES